MTPEQIETIARQIVAIRDLVQDIQVAQEFLSRRN